jgi:RNA polymerase sigma-70 factor (ECF subfamily)
LHDSSKRGRFEALTRPQLDALFRTARRIVGSAAVAEEVVQDTCLKAYERFDPADEPAQFRPWIFRILVNCSIDQIRRRGRELGLPLDGVPPTALEAVADLSASIAPDRIAESRELGQAIERALSDLAPELRAVVVLVLIEEMSYGEAAHSLAISEDLVRSRLSRARARLRERLNGTAGSAHATRPSLMLAQCGETKRDSR